MITITNDTDCQKIECEKVKGGLLTIYHQHANPEQETSVRIVELRSRFLNGVGKRKETAKVHLEITDPKGKTDSLITNVRMSRAAILDAYEKLGAPAPHCSVY